jgi:hypothetical protein
VRIGLDLDNTLACYEKLFLDEAKTLKLVPSTWQGTKHAVRERVKRAPGGDQNWQFLQGRVYGPRMKEAQLFPGVARFLIRCRLRGHKVFIVSHKTEFGHFDSTRTPLRKAASTWLAAKGFFRQSRFGLEERNVFFCGTREQKVQKIRDLELDVFVDDLIEVFQEEGFPEIQKILFNSQLSTDGSATFCVSWGETEEAVLGPVPKQEFLALTQEMCGEEITEIEDLKGRGNSQVFFVSTAASTKFALKSYPDLMLDDRPRLRTEVNAYNLLEDLGLTPKVFASDQEMNLALFEWLDGAPVTSVSATLIDQCISFIGELKNLYHAGEYEYATASEACLSRAECCSQIEGRIINLRSAEDRELQNAIDSVIEPLWRDISIWSEKEWPNERMRAVLAEEKQTLSPSDFGFHNTLEQSDGSLRFLDFEYFGRDDPVKLIVDFVWHPAMNLHWSHKRRWVKGMLALFKDDEAMSQRFKAAWPLFGMRWVLILLNEYLDDGWSKRVHARRELQGQKKQCQARQLEKSLRMCEEIRVHQKECSYV